MVFHHEDKGIVRYDHPGLLLSAGPGHMVTSYRELLKKVAALTYYNSRFRILFRGQASDYRLMPKGDRGMRSSLYPSILRSSSDKGREKARVLDDRFRTLFAAEHRLKERLSVQEIHRNRIVRWAMLQHYEVCPTPLLDVTQSLQPALSFALLGNRDDGFLFALAFPHLTGPVSVSIESMTQVVDLRQVCPPEALRPHFQRASLVGDYPAVDSREASHGGRGLVGNNFACRLLTKFKLTNCRAWANEGFSPTPQDILFPNSDDEWFSVLSSIKQQA